MLGYHLASIAKSIPEVLNGKAVAIEIDTADLRFTPREDSAAIQVWFDLHGVPADLRNDEPLLVEREAFVREVYTTIKSWCEAAEEINPDLATVGWFRDIETALARAKHAMEQADITVPNPGDEI